MSTHFPEFLSRKIVKGILTGYKSYLDERREKRRTMKISSAYAWVRGNHIDHAVAEICQTQGIEYKSSKAGYTWGYLQFENKANDEKTLFILKIGSIINNTTNGILQKKKEDQEKNYLVQLSNINKPHFNEAVDFVNGNQQLRLDFSSHERNISSSHESLEEIEDIKKDYTHFYIVTYDFDLQSKMLSSVNLFLPSPGLSQYKLVDNWDRYIEMADVQISTDDLQPLYDDKFAPEEVASSDYIVGKVPMQEKQSN
ncbi:hypothetical protein HUN88_04050 [Bacillus amyloliquefaciens]|uniref:spr1630 family ClpXP-sensitive toxin n=1 Tax=Bacillus amyloliquefaciens group TaxID=1938374 RepID=UPI0013D49B15|nr:MULTISPECIES: hypothetical protein [Bacillus amyloliquefaciens group]MCA1215901.1 hypothetical protein [Bacillus amyloliquefaciens]NUI58940.1 hypothetical protein [Bacillus amyloliquefaciens]